MERNGCGRGKCRYHFGGVCFSTQAQLRQHMGPMCLGQVEVASADASPEIFEFLCLALAVYSERDIFPEGDPDYFFVQQRVHPEYRPHQGWQPVWGEYVPDEWFSYSGIFQADPAAAKRLKVMRLEIRDQVDEVRAQFDGECDVHHVVPFKELVGGFLASEGIALADIDLSYPEGNAPSLMLDRDLAERWWVYHQENTELVAMTKEEHKAIHAAR